MQVRSTPALNALTAADGKGERKMKKGEKVVSGFLVTLLIMCFVMVTLGGYVRLSGSGLSIPEWPFFTIEEKVLPSGEVEKVRSVFPPMSEEGWELLRSTFVAKVPGDWEGIAMGEFKRMFWIEWSHRGLAKIIGLVYLAFMGAVMYFPETRRFRNKAFLGLGVLVTQAVLGGIVVLFHLAAIKVALHLLAAFIFTSLLLWVLMELYHPPIDRGERNPRNPVFVWSAVVLLLVAFQIFSGGLMAGSLAGFQMNTWPKMGEVYVPAGMFPEGMGFYENFTENVVMIQFFHRWYAFVLVLAILALVFRCMTVEVSKTARWGLRALFGIVVFQIILGIVTLLTGVHTHVALTHQLVGLILMLNCVLVTYEARTQKVLMEEALAERAEARNQASEGRGIPANA